MRRPWPTLHLLREMRLLSTHPVLERTARTCNRRSEALARDCKRHYCETFTHGHIFNKHVAIEFTYVFLCHSLIIQNVLYLVRWRNSSFSLCSTTTTYIKYNIIFYIVAIVFLKAFPLSMFSFLVCGNFPINLNGTLYLFYFCFYFNLFLSSWYLNIKHVRYTKWILLSTGRLIFILCASLVSFFVCYFCYSLLPLLLSVPSVSNFLLDVNIVIEKSMIEIWQCFRHSLCSLQKELMLYNNKKEKEMRLIVIYTGENKGRK